MTTNRENTQWDWEIGARTGWFTGFDIREIWNYRTLLHRWIRRDLILHYQQTLLGPVWIILQPLFTLATYLLVFGRLIGISTGGIPPVLFYMSSIVLWNFFSEGLLAASSTFTQNVSLFSKVYFPRIIVPIATIVSNMVRLLIQAGLLLVLLIIYWINGEYEASRTNAWLLFIPVAVILTAALSLGMGLLFSVLTGKYRDLVHVVNLGVRLLMFVTPVIYPLRLVPESVRWIVALNPMTPLMEAFRFGIFGEGVFTWYQLLYSFTFIAIVFATSVLLFNKQSDRIIDLI